MYSLQGVFFEKKDMLSVEQKSTVGAVVKMRSLLTYGMYYAVLAPDPTNEYEELYSGMMHDQYGDSAITQFLRTESEVKFTKTYSHQIPIYYVFDRQKDGIWYGTWKGAGFEGEAKCIITEIDETFLSPETPKAGTEPFIMVEEGLDEQPKDEEEF